MKSKIKGLKKNKRVRGWIQCIDCPDADRAQCTAFRSLPPPLRKTATLRVSYRCEVPGSRTRGKEETKKAQREYKTKFAK
jgi:hypothetical protein